MYTISRNEMSSAGITPISRNEFQPQLPLHYESEQGYNENYNSLLCPLNLEYRDEVKIAELTENFNGMSIEIRKKEKLLQEEQWAYLSTHPSKCLHSFCFDDDDDDEDYTSAITPDEPVLSTEEPDNSLKDTIEDFSESNEEFSSTDDDSFSFDKIEYVEASPPDSELVSSEVREIVIPEVGGIKASNDNPIPSYDPIIPGNPPNLTPSGENQIEDFSESNEEFASTDDDSFSFDKINYVEASPPDSELVSSEVMENVTLKVGGIKASNDNLILFYDPIISGTPPNLTPSGEKPEYSLSMGYEHLSTTPEMESDEVNKSSVEKLVPIPREYEDTSDNERECDVPVCEDSTTFDVLEDHSEILFDSNNDDISSDDDTFEDIDINRLIADIESLNDNPTPDRVLKSSASFPIFEESDNSLSNNSLPEFETFSDHTKETRSGSTTTHANNSLSEYDSFCSEIESDQGRLTSVVKNDISDDSTNDPLLEEVDLFLASDNSIPSGITNFDYD
nr:hypothetical protein [Tanacetum cinerariifolium]